LSPGHKYELQGVCLVCCSYYLNTQPFEKKILPKDYQKKLDERIARAVSRGFTDEYQKERENEDSSICFKQLAPASLSRYEDIAINWTL
jgi:hypothetical protein